MTFTSNEQIKEHLTSLARRDELCFLCGESQGLSDEHVFPQWLQKHFEIRDQRLLLLNRTHIAYRQLTIRCCLECNTRWLSRLEGQIRGALFAGYKAFRHLPEWSLYLWLSKILVGILIKESQLLLDRRTTGGDKIVSSEDLRQLSFMIWLLQIIREKAAYQGLAPGSIQVFPALQASERQFRFDFIDDPHYWMISLYLGRVAVVASLFDRRALNEFHPGYWRPFQREPIHPLQYREIVSHFLYKRRLLREVPGHKIARYGEDDHVLIVPDPLPRRFVQDTFEEWKSAEYLSILRQLTGCPMDDVPDGLHVSWLRDPAGKPLRLTFDDIPPVLYPHDSWVKLSEAIGYGVLSGSGRGGSRLSPGVRKRGAGG